MFNLFKRESESAVSRISPKQAQELLATQHDIALIDVRTPEEFRQRRIKGSKNMPLDSIGTAVTKAIPDKSKPLILYCLSGARSAQACSILSQLGYEKVYNLGGISAWPYETTSN